MQFVQESRAIPLGPATGGANRGSRGAISDRSKVRNDAELRTMSAVTDSLTTLQRIAAGDSSAVAEFVDRYSGWVMSIARGYVQDLALAEDAVQEIFLEVWKNASRYDPSIASEATFVATVARRRLIDMHRKRQRRPQIEAVEVEAAGGFDDGGIDRVELRDEAALAAEAIDQLKPDQRDLLRMWIMEGLTHGEIAERTGRPLGTVKSHLRRGLMKVRELLGVTDDEEAS